MFNERIQNFVNIYNNRIQRLERERVEVIDNEEKIFSKLGCLIDSAFYLHEFFKKLETIYGRELDVEITYPDAVVINGHKYEFFG